MNDYYFSPARVVIVRYAKSKHHKQLLKHLEIISENMYSVQGHISSHIFISTNQDYEIPDPCGIGTLTIKTSRFLLSSRWKSVSAWQAYLQCHDQQLAKSLTESLILYEDIIVTNSFCAGIADHRFVPEGAKSMIDRKKPLDIMLFIKVPVLLISLCFLGLLWLSYYVNRNIL